MLETPANSDYRPDIDGLRAIALVAVLLFHLGFEKFAGGFVGVDVFFVISGYLITSIIKSDLERDRFSFGRFFGRRGRRLLPGLFVVVAASSVAAFLMFSPTHLRSFAYSAAASVFGVSNILFWRESDYFDLSAHLKPLLHTWTLSLEWQFYLAWPAFVSLVCSERAKWSAPSMIAAAGTISLIVAMLLGLFWPATTFYNMPFRIYEFAIGALLIWAPPIRHIAALELLSVAGLALIMFATLMSDGRTFHNPAEMLVPAIGAALVIWTARASGFGIIVRNRVAAYIGRISYSVYLVHWPLIVFTEYFFFRRLTTTEASRLLIISIALGAALHHLIENPIHRRKIFDLTGYANFTITALAALLITIPALLAIPDGLPWRIDANALGLRYQNTDTLVSKDIIGHMGCAEPCVFGKEAGQKVLVFGDSHVDHFTRTLDRLGGDRYRFHYAGYASCFNGATLTSRSSTSPSLTAGCKKARETLLTWIKTYTYAAVIIGQRWHNYGNALYRGDEKVTFADQAVEESNLLQDVTTLFSNFKRPIIIVGWAPITNTACYNRPRYISMTCPTISFAEYNIFRRTISEFKSRTANLDIRFIDVAQIVCPHGQCATTDHDGHILYTDADHLSIYGAALVVPQFLSIIDKAARVDAPPQQR